MQNIHTILGGDLNLYIDQRLDKLDNSPDYNDNRNFRAEVCYFVETNNIIDVWRTINPDKRCFTWHRGDKISRLDYLLSSEHLLNFIDDVDILPGIQSDHSLLKLSLKTGNKHEKDRGFWKFDSSLLHDPLYVAKNKIVVRETAQNYEGISLSDFEIKITQMADDTTCFVKDKISLKNLIDVFENFEICSGLKINLDKTKAKALGPEPEPNNKPFRLDWVNDPIYTLGNVAVYR